MCIKILWYSAIFHLLGCRMQNSRLECFPDRENARIYLSKVENLPLGNTGNFIRTWQLWSYPVALKKRADILLKFYFCRSSQYIEPLYQDYYGTPVAGDAEHEQEGNMEVSIWSHVLNEQSDLSSHSSIR